MIPGPGRPAVGDVGALFSPHSPAKVDTHIADRGSLLLTSGTADLTVPLRVINDVFGLISKGPSGIDFRGVDDRGHSLTIDDGCKTSLMSCCNGWRPKDSEAGGTPRCDAIFASGAIPRVPQAGPAGLPTDHPRYGLHSLC